MVGSNCQHLRRFIVRIKIDDHNCVGNRMASRRIGDSMLASRPVDLHLQIVIRNTPPFKGHTRHSASARTYSSSEAGCPRGGALANVDCLPSERVATSRTRSTAALSTKSG